MDLISYALSKKVAASAVSGVKSMSVEGQTLKIVTNDSGTLTMTFPTPKDGISVTDIDVNANNQIVFTMSDGSEFISGKIPTVKGDKGDPFKYSDFTQEQLDALKGSDGFSPSAKIEKVGDTATITITDKDGTTTATIKDGQGGSGGSGEENKIEVIKVNGIEQTIAVDKSVDITVPSTEGLASETWVNEQGFLTEHQDLSNYATKDEIPSLEGYAKTEDIPLLDGYAKTSELPTKVSQLENDNNYLTSIPEEYITETELDEKGYLTDHQDLSDYAKTSDVTIVLETKLDKTFAGNDIANKFLSTDDNGNVVLKDNIEVNNGKSAYEIAIDNGFVGTETEWLESLNGKDFTYNDFTTEQLESLKVKGDDGISPTVTVTKSGYKSVLTVTDKNGTTSVNIFDGINAVEVPTDNPFQWILDKTWLTGYSWGVYGNISDKRYTTTNEILMNEELITITNPNINKYYISLGYFDSNGNYTDNRVDNFSELELPSGTYFKIAIKFTDNRTLTDDDVNTILNDFFISEQSNVFEVIEKNISDLSDKIDELTPKKYEETEFTVGENGDYQSLKDALDNINDNSKEKRYIIKVLEGTYDLPNTEKHFGIKNYVRIVGENKYNCIIRNMYSDTVYDNTRNTFDAEHYGESIEYASIENLTIICKGGKAPIHIDTSLHADGGLIEIKNCILRDMNTLSMSNIPIRSNNYNAGGINVGMLGGRSVKVYDTISNGSIYAHNQSNQSKPCYFEVNHCQFAYTIWGDLGSNQEDVAVFNNCHFDDLYFGCNSSLSSTKVKTILHNNDIRTITSYGSDWTDGNGFAGWNQVFDGKCRVIENNIHMEVLNKSDNTIKAGSLVELVSIRGVNLNGVHVKEYDGGLLMGYAMENIASNDFGLIQYRNDVEIPLIDGINVGDEIEYTNGNYQKKTTGKTVGYYIGSAPYFRYKMRLNVK